MFWYRRFQVVFLAVLVTFQSGNGERIRRMSYEVLQDELDFAESVIRQTNGDWSARLSQGEADSSPSSTAPSQSTVPSKASSISAVTQAPHTHITSIIKAIRVLEDIKDEKPTSAPKKKRYFKGAYKSISTSKKVRIIPTALPLKQEKTTEKISPTTETKSLPTAASVKKSTKSTRNTKPDQYLLQPPTGSPTTPLPKTLTSAPSKKSDKLLRRATVKEYTPTRATPSLRKTTEKIPTAYLIPVDMKITSPADVISKSVTKSIQKIPKWQSSAKATKKASANKPSKRPMAKKVVVVKKVIKPTRKTTTTVSPTAGYKYPELYNYRQQNDESEEDYSNEYRKRLQKEYDIPRYEDSDEDHYRFTRPLRRMKVSSYSSNEEPEEPRIEYPSFEMPKIDLSASNLNQKGCKTVVKEVQEHPINDKNASATILHPVFYHYSPFSRKKRSVKSIIVTKECVFPGDEDEETKTPYQPQADNHREIYQPYSSKRPDILKPQSSKISTDQKEYSEEPRSERYSKSFSRSYHSTSKPYRKEHSYYSTSKPVVKKYSHSESSGKKDGGNHNYNPYEPKNFGHDSYGFRPSYHNDYQGPYGEESRGVYRHGSFQIPDYGKLVRENYHRMPDYSRDTSHDHVYRPAYESHHGRNRDGDKRKESGNSRGDDKDDKPKKARKSFAYYRKDNDPKNNGFSEQYAQGSYASYSTDYDSDRDGPERGAKRS